MTVFPTTISFFLDKGFVIPDQKSARNPLLRYRLGGDTLRPTRG